MSEAAVDPTLLSDLRTENARLRYLVGCVIKALGFFDSDDGHAALIRAGVVSELKDITKCDIESPTPPPTEGHER